jgi:hypothetical protein
MATGQLPGINVRCHGGEGELAAYSPPYRAVAEYLGGPLEFLATQLFSFKKKKDSTSRTTTGQSMPWLYIGPEVSILGLISVGLVWVASRA